MDRIARFESKSGRWFLEIFRSGPGRYDYRADGAMGSSLPFATDEDAIRELGERAGDFQPDANKSPMRRVL